MKSCSFQWRTTTKLNNNNNNNNNDDDDDADNNNNNNNNNNTATWVLWGIKQSFLNQRFKLMYIQPFHFALRKSKS